MDSNNRYDRLQSLLSSGAIPQDVLDYLFPGHNVNALISGETSRPSGSEDQGIWPSPGGVSFKVTVPEPKSESLFYDEDFEPSPAPKAKKPRRTLRSFFRPSVVEMDRSAPAGLFPSDAQDEEDERLEASITIQEDIKRDKVNRLREILAQNNFTVEDLTLYIEYQRKISRMEIYRTGKIVLPDFNQLEVKMPTLMKTVYFFYLRHPEGVEFKQLVNYKDELERIYMGISNRSDTDKMRRSIEGLCNSVYDNSINVTVSKIKSAFLSVMAENVAKEYFIQGPAGEKKYIPLDRSLVHWR